LGHKYVYGCRFKGIRHDCGDKFGYLKATVDMALKREEFNGKFKSFLKKRLAESEKQEFFFRETRMGASGHF
jgi:UTP--glucose-1-phosphate uridylyltransferase